jgi:5-methylcytosine-specific restriction endonuclease McrA
MRSVDEWVGKSDDQAVPDRVKVRVFERYNGTCYLSGVKIRPGDKWQVEHIVALANGGEHRESNMAPALSVPHKEKTKLDLKIKAKIARVRKRHLGIKKRGRTIPGRRFNGDPIPSKWR